MKKYLQIYALVMCVLLTSCKGQDKTDQTKYNIKTEVEEMTLLIGPNSVTRNMIQDRKGNIWIASFEGIFRNDKKTFTNITKDILPGRFFSVLEDRKGNFWFATIGSGVYYYDGNSFLNFTTKDGLLNNDVGSIYEDKQGNVWFGVFGGTSRYDGKFFRNYILDGSSMNEDSTGKTYQERSDYEVTSIIEDRTGKFWFGSRGNTFIYDGITFTNFTNKGKPFTNVRSIIEDKKGNIWLGGNDGLWRYDGSSFTNFTQSFVGYVYEDRKGNIWTSSERVNSQNWELNRYDEKSLYNNKPNVNEIKPEVGMIFGILEDTDGNIWFGGLDGVYRYDGHSIKSFKGKVGVE